MAYVYFSECHALGMHVIIGEIISRFAKEIEFSLRRIITAECVRPDNSLAAARG
jgi:hypothetical protein